MTKRVIISVLLLILALSLSLCSYFILENRFSLLGNELENAIYTDTSPKESSERILKCWNDNTKLFHIFILHSDLSDLQTEIESLQDLYQNAQLYHIQCIRCLHLMRGVRESISLDLSNILNLSQWRQIFS